MRGTYMDQTGRPRRWNPDRSGNRSTASARPDVVRFEAVDLADVVPGEDLSQWADYIVSDYVFEVDQGFSIYFDPALYETCGAHSR